MKKLLKPALFALLLGVHACSDSEPQPVQAILISPEQTAATLPAAETTHTIRFETSAAWELSARDEATSAEPTWLTLSPRSGDAGEQAITATLDANTGSASRQAVITLSCAGEQAAITLVQEGAAGSSRPERPEVAPENWLSLIEIETVKINSGQERKTYRTIYVEYDEENWPTRIISNTLDAEGNRLSESHQRTFSFSKNQMRAGSSTATIYTFDKLPALFQKDFMTTYTFSTNGRLRKSNCYIPKELNVTDAYTYNTDGSLATLSNQNGEETETARYAWKEGDLQEIVSRYEIFGHSTESVTTFAYTDHSMSWHGIDLTALLLERETDMPTLLGMIGLASRHLPSEKRIDSKQVYSYEYSFDPQQRLATITITSDNMTKRITLHYGAQPAPQQDFPAHLTGQEVTDEGILGYTFAAENPEERTVAADSYTSWAKIRSTMSDGTTSEAVKYVPVSWEVEVQKSLPILVSAAEFAALKLNSVSVRLDANGSAADNRLQYTLSANYSNLFSGSVTCGATAPTCSLYDIKSQTGSVHLMPTYPLTQERITRDELETEATGADTYRITQRFHLKFNPEAEQTIACKIEQQLKVSE